MPLLFRLMSVLVMSLPLQAIANDQQLYPTFPSFPTSYAQLDAGTLISEARVDFSAVPKIEKTDGFQVISPDGDVFYVDNIDQPKCAFYASYVANDDGDISGAGSLEVFSNVYIEEVNFENCQ